MQQRHRKKNMSGSRSANFQHQPPSNAAPCGSPHKSPSPSVVEEADKFHVFERWLRINGAQFPLLELRKYDAPCNKREDPREAAGRLSNLTDDDAEEKKDAAVDNRLHDGSEGVAMISLDGTRPTKGSRHRGGDGGGDGEGDSDHGDNDDGSGEMRGVHARTSIPPQTVVVSIPKSCLITVEMGQSTPIGRKILQSDLELDAPKHIFLMIYLLWDRKVHGAKSFFAPYYDILPKTLRNMPIFWTDEELAQLRGSHLLVQIADRADAIKDDYESICSVAPEFAAIATLPEFQWARMIVCSRNFGLLINGHRTSALVPHADMLNHYRPRETKWTFCEETQSFTITTLQTIGRGEQVYDSYGQKCNHRFLLNYGFCVERNVEVDGFCPNEVPLELGMDMIRREEAADEELWESKAAFWSRGEQNNAAATHQFDAVSGVGSSFHALAAAVAAGASTARTTGAASLGSADIVRGLASMADGSAASALAEVVSRGGGTAPAAPSARSLLPRAKGAEAPSSPGPVRRVRVCASNNENTRALFSMLRSLACNACELDRIASGIAPPSSYSGGPSPAVQRLFGVPSPGGGGVATGSSSSLRTCRDVRHPISLRNERRALELLLDLTARSLSRYPTSLAQDRADLLDEDVFPKYSNGRNARLQVRGEKEVLHHFALWARTGMHVIDIVARELDAERDGQSRGRRGRSSSAPLLGSDSDDRNLCRAVGGFRRSRMGSRSDEIGYDYVVRAMEEDDDCHTTILRYCSDVLGAVRRDEMNRIAVTDSLARSCA